MKKTINAFRVAALLGTMGTASALLMSGSTPAKAGEERLHSSSTKVYGLIPVSESNKGASATNSVRAANANSSTTVKSGNKNGAGKSASSGNLGNEPKVEDPPMPSYDGPNGGNTMASNDGAGSASYN